MLLKENLERTAHLLQEMGQTITAVPLVGLFQVEIEMVPHTYRGVKINELSFLWPEKPLREAALDAAKKFVAHMKLQPEEYELVHNEADVEVWGPYRHRQFRNDFSVVHTMATDEPFPDGIAAMRLRGWFVPKYARMLPVERDGSTSRLVQHPVAKEYGGTGL